MTRSAKKTDSFLAAHAAPLPAHVTRESVLATLHAMPNLAARAPAIVSDMSHASHHDSEGRALFTVTRPRVLDRDGLTELHLCDGRLVAAFAGVPSIRKAFEAVIGYLAQALPADCDPAAEVESYRASFRENWESTSVYPMFRASCLTRAARWAFRLAAAEAEAKARAEGVESMASGPDWAGPEFGPFYAQEVARDGARGRFAFGQTEAEARAALAALVAPAPFTAPCKGEVGYTEPAPAEVVDVNPTWAAVARIIELGLTHGNATGRQIAREELARMAAIADSAVAAAKAAEGRAEALAMARAKLAQYPDVSPARAGSSLGLVRDSARDLRDTLAALVATL